MESGVPAPLSSRDEVVARLFEVFRDHGYDGATLSELSRATGLGKSSLYHYFPNGKEDMALAVIKSTDSWLRENVAAVANGAGTPRVRLTRILAAIDQVYAGGSKACVLGSLVSSGLPQPFQRRLNDAFDVWIGALAQLALEAGASPKRARARAEDAVASIEGALILAAGVNDPAPFRRRLRAIPDALLTGANDD
jgi:TetR/AcrR family transcriptional repressor of lmrAB and yxaGH operons